MIFNGESEWHANMVSPVGEQRRQIIERVVNAISIPKTGLPKCPDCAIPQLDGDHDERDWNELTDAERREAQAEARRDLREQNLPNFLVQQIVCYYFQRQQRSYFLNTYNRENPSNPIAAEDFDYNENELNVENQNPHDDAAPQSDPTEDPGHQEQEAANEHADGLSEYELARLQRIRENQAAIARLGIRPFSSLRL